MCSHRFVFTETILAVTFVLLLLNPGGSVPPIANSASANDPGLIYSDDPNDPWNRIFHSLFTRKIKARLSDDFPEAAPFVQIRDGFSRLKGSTRIFERFENGDRPIDPLYPSFFNNAGVLQVLNEPAYSELKTALESALAEKAARAPLDRALMQIDAWA